MLCNPHSLVLSGMDLVERWRSRVPLDEVMADTFDGRTISGMRKVIDRFEDPKCKADYSASDKINLKNFNKLVKVAESLIPSKLRSHTDEDLEKLISILVKENVKWPLVVQHGLLTRAIQATVVQHMSGVGVCRPILGLVLTPTLDLLWRVLRTSHRLFQSWAIVRRLCQLSLFVTSCRFLTTKHSGDFSAGRDPFGWLFRGVCGCVLDSPDLANEMGQTSKHCGQSFRSRASWLPNAFGHDICHLRHDKPAFG